MSSNAPAPEQGGPPPATRNNEIRFFQRMEEKLKASGNFLLENPGWLLVWVFVFPAVQVLASILNIPAWVYFQFNPPPTGHGVEEHVEAVEMMINASTSIIGPLATLLGVSCLVANGLINRVKDLDAYIRNGHDQLTMERREILNQFIIELRSGARQIGETMSRHAHKNIEAFVPAWVVVMDDEVVRDQLAKLVTRLRGAIQHTKPQDRIIARSLMKGLTLRFERLMDQVAHSGAYMEPMERRELTDELSQATKSYHVIYWGVARIKYGPWKWHVDYLDFLVRAARDFNGDVTWTFILDDDHPAGEDLLRSAVDDVQSCGVKCYVFDKRRKGDLPWSDFKDFFKTRGPFFEVFGPSFNNNRKGIVLGDGSITWKATAFGRRVGKNLLQLTAEEAEACASGEGVWAADEIDKVVRAGLVASSTDAEFRLLDQVHRRREAA